MKIENFKFNPEAIGKANYVGSEKAPAIIEGKPFDGTRHIVMEDYVEGTNFSASTNVLAKGLKRVGGNK